MKQFKLTLGSMFRLAAVTAIALSAMRWIPRSSTTIDGNTSHYNLQFNGHRHYYAMSGNDTGCKFEAKIKQVPGYADLKSFYPNGALREHAQVYVQTQTDGLKVYFDRVESGKYYLPDGSVCSSVENGTGVVSRTRASGKLGMEFKLDRGLVVEQKHWYRNGKVAQETRTEGLTSEVTNYFPEGMPHSIWSSEGGRIIDQKYFDREGKQVPQPVAPWGNLAQPQL